MTPRRTIHFIGIGGIGMSGIAKILLKLGYAVSGSDLKENHETEQLLKAGAEVFIGHRAGNIGKAEAVVYSSAVPKENPEFMEALRLRLPVLARAEMLAELMRLKKSIVVAGAHGKTTTSAMITSLLHESGFDSTAVIGGRLKSMASNAKLGSDDWFVCESDESDGSFLKLLPTIAVITNIDAEHLNHYGTFDELKRAFLDFSNRVPFDGVVIVNKDDGNCADVINGTRRRFLTYGLDPNADYIAKDVQATSKGMAFSVWHQDKKLADVEIPVAGKHNVLNALATFVVGVQLDISGPKIAAGLQSFSGIERRLELKGTVREIEVIDDYAHHPTEIRASIEALRLKPKRGAIRLLFQPHRYSRVRDLWDEFVTAFDGVDEVALTPIYSASENPISGITSERLAETIHQRGKCDARYYSSLDEASMALVQHAKPKDVLVTMGAGDITRSAAVILADLEQPGVRMGIR